MLPCFVTTNQLGFYSQSGDMFVITAAVRRAVKHMLVQQ